jgi:hypothetical protein
MAMRCQMTADDPSACATSGNRTCYRQHDKHKFAVSGVTKGVIFASATSIIKTGRGNGLLENIIWDTGFAKN